MIQEPSDVVPGTIDTIDFMKDDGVAMERTADNWVKSKDYLCLTSRKCDEFCDWKVVSNPNQPLIACEPNVALNPPEKYPAVVFRITHVYSEGDNGGNRGTGVTGTGATDTGATGDGGDDPLSTSFLFWTVLSLCVLAYVFYTMFTPFIGINLNT